VTTAHCASLTLHTSFCQREAIFLSSLLTATDWRAHSVLDVTVGGDELMGKWASVIWPLASRDVMFTTQTLSLMIQLLASAGRAFTASLSRYVHKRQPHSRAYIILLARVAIVILPSVSPSVWHIGDPHLNGSLYRNCCVPHGRVMLLVFRANFTLHSSGVAPNEGVYL